MDRKTFTVAIDGPSGAGKSSIARRVAKAVGFLYVDTGAIYRTVGLAAHRRSIDPHDRESVTAMLPELRIELRHAEGGEQRMFLDGEDVSADIRLPEISLYASDVSALPEVRAFLLNMQRTLAEENDVIMDGRDIGTVVLPEAGLKIFLTAAAEKRALRRQLELEQKGTPQPYEDVLREILLRDHNDSTRETAPLRQADDAVLVDTTELDLEQSCAAVESLIRKRFGI